MNIVGEIQCHLRIAFIHKTRLTKIIFKSIIIFLMAFTGGIRSYEKWSVNEKGDKSGYWGFLPSHDIKLITIKQYKDEENL